MVRLTGFGGSLLAAAGLGVGLIGVTQPYSVRSPWAQFDGPARRYFDAAARGDSAALAAATASRQPVAWALETAVAAPGLLGEWKAWARASAGFPHGQTADVLFEAATDACPILLTFTTGSAPRVAAVRAWCYHRRGWPADPLAVIPRLPS